MQICHPVLALGERALSFLTITSSPTVLNRFLQGNLAEFNTDENVSFPPSNTKGWRRLAMGIEKSSSAVKVRNSEASSEATVQHPSEI